jgi:hypothetical protein
MQIKTQRGCNVIFPSIPVRASPMEWERIRKCPDDVVRANLRNYEDCAGSFSWAQARALLDGLPDGGLNIAHEAIDRHVLAGRGGKLALRGSAATTPFASSATLTCAPRAVASRTFWRNTESPRATGRSRCWAVARSSTWPHSAHCETAACFHRSFPRSGRNQSKHECPSAPPRCLSPRRRFTAAKSNPGAMSWPALNSYCSPNATTGRPPAP